MSKTVETELLITLNNHNITDNYMQDRIYKRKARFKYAAMKGEWYTGFNFFHKCNRGLIEID